MKIDMSLQQVITELIDTAVKGALDQHMEKFETLIRNQERLRTIGEILKNPELLAKITQFASGPLVDISEASTITRLSQHTLYKKVSARTIPFVKLGGKLFFERKKLLEHIDENSHEPIPRSRQGEGDHGREKKEAADRVVEDIKAAS